jgi:hypothetical protein
MNSGKFQTPEQLTKTAQQNVEHVSTAYTQFTQAMTDAMSMWTNALPSNEVTKGFQALQELSIRFAKENSEAGLEHAKKLASAKDLTELTRLQTLFAQTQMKNFAAQSQEYGQLMLKASSRK